jgi:hypothetical protein
MKRIVKPNCCKTLFAIVSNSSVTIQHRNNEMYGDIGS